MKIVPTSIRVNKLDLKSLDALDSSLELMYFGWKGMTREADEFLATYGLSRAHHRILFTIARRDGVTVGELQANLGISKQAMHRPLKQLLDIGAVVVSRNPSRHRFKLLHLTELGRQIEKGASDRERSVMRAAFAQVGDGAQEAWLAVMAVAAENA